MMSYFTRFSTHSSGSTYLLWFCLAALIGLQIHNLVSYPSSRGFDAAGHMAYINWWQTEKRVPLANEGWELYQPPLYYWLSGLVPHPDGYKLVNFSAWISIGLSAFLTVKRLTKDRYITMSLTVITLSLPVLIYLTPAVGNELLATAMITGGIYWLVRTMDQTIPKNYLVWGMNMGLALLTKATAWVAFIPSGIWLFTQKRRLALVASLTALLIGGWFYARNALIFGNPFISSIDFPQYAINQLPGYRDLDFWLKLKPLWQLDLFKAHWSSFLGGTYFSFFYDGHNNLIPVQADSKAGKLLVLVSGCVTGLALYGIIKAAKRHNRLDKWFLTYTGLLILAFAGYNLKLPFYSTVKGSFIASLALPLVYFLIPGLQQFPKRSVIAWFCLGWTVLIIKNFWILPGWYR